MGLLGTPGDALPPLLPLLLLLRFLKRANRPPLRWLLTEPFADSGGLARPAPAALLKANASQPSASGSGEAAPCAAHGANGLSALKLEASTTCALALSEYALLRCLSLPPLALLCRMGFTLPPPPTRPPLRGRSQLRASWSTDDEQSAQDGRCQWGWKPQAQGWDHTEAQQTLLGGMPQAAPGT
jgi:hypothetical protein